MELPLLTRAQEGTSAFHLTTNGGASEADDLVVSQGSYCAVGSPERLPPTPGPGEQYRFHFDMTKCIGCKCCVVACNEQNGNPADILWRRVGEIEGGTYPETRRHYLSMGCNHCVEPTCMTGCPVDAYSKDGLTGIVLHSAEMCIGCQYCTWNCSYGVPQYNPERGVVGKCDMCYGRLTRGEEPACSSACPEEAIRIEVVRIDEWRNEYQGLANSPGMPSADDSLSTTRITLPGHLPGDLRKVDLTHLRPEHAHWSLIAMTVFTQLSAGAFAAIWTLQATGAQTHRIAALVALCVAGVALAASTLHLGRPIYAIRALKMWRRSWLSREVLLFTLFALSATCYSSALWLGVAIAPAMGALTALLGVCGVGASARLYLAPGRPAWNSLFTLSEFWCTAGLFGAAGANILTNGAVVARMTVLGAVGLVTANFGLKLIWLAHSKRHELRGSWQLLSTVFAHQATLRVALLCCCAALVSASDAQWGRIALAVAAVGNELLGRYLFFVTVVPTNMAREYLAQEAA